MVRAVVYREGNMWVAQGVDYDIGVQAPDVDTLHRRMELAIELEKAVSIELCGAPFAGIDRAPAYVEEMHRRSTMNLTPSQGTPQDVQLALCA